MVVRRREYPGAEGVRCGEGTVPSPEFFFHFLSLKSLDLQLLLHFESYFRKFVYDGCVGTIFLAQLL